MNSEEKRRLLNKIEKDMLTEADLDAIEKMEVSEELQQYKEILLASGRLEIPNASSNSDAWQNLMNVVQEPQTMANRPPQAKQSYLPWRWSLGIAATLLLLALVSWFWPTKISSAPGELVDHELPDGSKLKLNAGSSVTYFPLRYRWRRRIQHEGEVFYDILPGASFAVYSESFTVEVLGTSFNVVDRAGKRSVVCETGKVTVSAEDEQVLLTSGQEGSLQGDQLSKKAASGTSQWRDGIYLLENVSLQFALSEIERAFGVDVHYDEEPGEQRLTVSFTIEYGASVALENVLAPLGMSYVMKGDVFEIR